MHDGGGAFALHDTLVAHGREVQGYLSVFSETLYVASHGVADVDARRVGSNHEAARVAVVYQKINVVAGDFVSGELHLLAQVEFRSVGVQEALDFFGGHDAVALFVFENVHDAAVAAPEFTELLLVGKEQVLVQAPIQECADAVHVLDFEYGKFADGSVGLVEGGDGAVFGIHVDKYVQDFTFCEAEFFFFAGEKHAPAGFKFQVVTLGHDFFYPGAVVFA